MSPNDLRCITCAGIAALCFGAAPLYGQTAPSLGAAQNFAVLAGSTVTNTGSTVVTGSVGVNPGSAATGFPPGTINSGSINTAASALAAQNALITANNALSSRPCDQDLTGQNLGVLTLVPGVYCFSSAAQLTGLLTLDAQGDSAAVFVIRIGSALTTASGSSVAVINQGSVCNVFWQVGTSATLGTNSSFSGNILALSSITLTTGANLTGRAFARDAAVTLDTNAVNAGACLVACPVIVLSPASLSNAAVGVNYSQALTGSGGVAPYGSAVTSDPLPGGLTLTPAGLLSGVPTTPGSFPLTIALTDTNSCLAERAYNLTVGTAVPTLPQAMLILLALGLGGLGYLRVRRRARTD